MLRVRGAVLDDMVASRLYCVAVLKSENTSSAE